MYFTETITDSDSLPNMVILQFFSTLYSLVQCKELGCHRRTHTDVVLGGLPSRSLMVAIVGHHTKSYLMAIESHLLRSDIRG